MSESNGQYIYGRTHHKVYPLRARIHSACDKYLERIRNLKDRYEFNNLMIEFRNEAERIIDEMYQQLSVLAHEGANITPSARGKDCVLLDSAGRSCLICGETRIVDKCHVIPREHKGSNYQDNLFFLCPTHHFLFDHHRLSQEEWARLTIDHLASDSREYILSVRHRRHQQKWESQQRGLTIGDNK